MIEFDFRGKHAVITGAGGGMGEQIAFQILKAGGNVTAIDLKPCPVRLSGFGGSLIYAQGDITDAAFVNNTIETTAERFEGIDFLANVAGVLWFEKDASMLDMDMSVWDQVFDINLKSMVIVARAVVPHIRAGKNGGALVHFSTTQWYRGDRHPQDAYQASKAGVCALSKSLAMQLAAENIRSNAICPGMTVSPLQARWDTEEKKAAVAAAIPIGRIATPRDMANTCLFLFSDEASYITGTEIIVDGGLLMNV
jgi:NAD(P)-dependent dehydrogenase (short-subunit alcohol dehydrogenase family)